MIDLHLHLDGSLSEQDYLYLSELEKIPLPANFYELMQVPDNCSSLDDCLKCFEFPLQFLQSKNAITYVTRSLVNRLYRQGYVYLEIRFAPQLHLLKGLTQKEVVEAAIMGLKQGLLGKVNFDANLILCMMRNGSVDANFETVKLAEAYRDDKVVAIDIAGPESYTSLSTFKKCFEYAQNKKINVTIHAGEECDSFAVSEAITLGAKRIGHGIHYLLDNNNVRLVLNNNIAFEFCPTSNVETGGIKSYGDLPLDAFLKYGICVTINSDDMTVCGTDVLKEFRHLYQTFKLPIYVVQQLLMNSVRASFADIKTKAMMTNVINERLQNYYQLIIRQ